MTILFTIKLNQFSTVIGYHKSDIAWDFDFSETELQN
jgi:hypothetical protein